MSELRHYVKVLRHIWQQGEREYLQANAGKKDGMKYEKVKVKKGKK